MSRNWLWVALIIAVILGIIWEFTPLRDAQHRMSSLPLYGEGYMGKDVPKTDYEEQYLTDVNTLKRIYKVGDDSFFVYLLDGTHNRHAIHDPTYCFRGEGWDIVEKKETPLANGTAMTYFLKKNGQSKEVLMWFSDGKKPFNSPIAYWMTTMLRRVTLGASGEEPVLVVVQPLDHTKPFKWEKLVESVPQLKKI